MNHLARKLLPALITISLSSAVMVFALRYRSYGETIVWHSLHSETVSFGQHRLEIPSLWWPTRTDIAGQVTLLRASKSAVFFEPKIEISPASLGQVADNDAEQSRIAGTFVSTLNRDPKPGWTHSVTSLRSKDLNWYCTRDGLGFSGEEAFTTLVCNAAGVHYTLLYAGPPENEGEAKSIFSTLQ